MVKSTRYISEASMLQLSPDRTIAVISITEPGRSAPIGPGWGALLRVRFCDAEWDTAMIKRLQSRGVHFDADRKGFPSHASVGPIRDFLEALEGRSEIDEVLVHCHAGQRRSAAVAKYAAERLGLPFDHAYGGYNQTVFRLLNEGMARAESEPLLKRIAQLFRSPAGLPAGKKSKP